MAVNILVECPVMTASVKVGVLKCLELLEKEDKCSVRFSKTIKITSKDIKWCDVLITVRGCESTTLHIVEKARKYGRFIVYYLDDDLLNVPIGIACPPIYYNQIIKKNMINVIKLCDVIWGVNEKLCQKYAGYLPGKRYVINKAPYRIADAIREKTEKTRVLYAGSSSHEPLVQQVLSPVIRKLSAEYPDVDFCFIGVNSGIENAENVFNTAAIGNYEEYRRFVEEGRFSVGLAVIKTDEFYQCKYYNKFLEYTSVGCAGVYTNTPPYTLVIKNGENGLLCDNGFDPWYDSIKLLIEDRELRKKCIENASGYVRTEHDISRVSEKLAADMPELVSYKAKEIDKRFFVIYPMKILFLFFRCKESICEYGFFKGAFHILRSGVKFIKKRLVGARND